MTDEMNITTEDETRVARMVQGVLSGDDLLLGAALADVLEDPRGPNGTGGVVAALVSMAQTLAGALVDIHGQAKASALLQQIIVSNTADDAPM